jgi:hypothetical protein
MKLQCPDSSVSRIMFINCLFASFAPILGIIPFRFALLIIYIFLFHVLSLILNIVYPATHPASSCCSKHIS